LLKKREPLTIKQKIKGIRKDGQIRLIHIRKKA